MRSLKTGFWVMADLLSAASLLLAIIGVLNGLWYAEIKSILLLDLPIHKEDRQVHLKNIRSVLWGKAIPLTLASVSVFFVFLPPCLTIAIRSWNGYARHGISFLLRYDAIATSLVLVEIFASVVAVHSIIWLIKLWNKKNS